MPQSKTQMGKLSKKSKPICTLYPGPSHKQGHTKTQNKVLVKDLPIKWRAKKKKKTHTQKKPRSYNFHL